MPIVAKLDELGKPAWIALMILGFFILVAAWSCHLGIHYGERTNDFLERRGHDSLVWSGCRDLVAALAAGERQPGF